MRPESSVDSAPGVVPWNQRQQVKADCVTTTDPDRLRVLNIIGRMNAGGVARQVATLTLGIDRSRFDQRLLVGSVSEGETDDLALRGVKVPHKRVGGLGRAPSPLNDIQALATLASEIRRFRPHLIHTHTAKAGALGRAAALAAVIPRQRRPALVHTFHGHLLHGYFSPRVTRVVTQAERMLAWRTDRLIAVGSQVRNDLVAAGIGKTERWVVVPPGVELRPFVSAAAARAALGVPVDAPVVAFVARLTAVKRPDRFLAVAAKVVASHPDAVFLVAGDGELAGELRSSAANAGIAEQVRMLGWTGDVEGVYAAADVVLLTSDNEGMPVSLIEAALAGRPAVTPAVGSAAEVVADGETGFVVAPGDVDALAAAVCRLLDDADLRHTMGATAARRAEHRFSTVRLVADTEQIYTDLARERGWCQ